MSSSREEEGGRKVSVGSGINPELNEIGSVKLQRLQAVNLARWKNLIQLLVAAVGTVAS